MRTQNTWNQKSPTQPNETENNSNHGKRTSAQNKNSSWQKHVIYLLLFFSCFFFHLLGTHLQYMFFFKLKKERIHVPPKW
jgi:hypothetical protein